MSSRLTKAKQAIRDDARTKLAEIAPEGSVIYCIVRHVSRSGMRRVIGAYVIRNDDRTGKPWFCNVGPALADAIGWRYDHDRGGVIVDGCGMNMCFHLVYTGAACVFGHGDRGGYKWREETL